MRTRRTRLYRRSAFLALMALIVSLAATCVIADPAPAGRVVYDRTGPIDISVFDVHDLIQSKDLPAKANVFPQKLLPSGYKTCYSERRKSKYLKIIRPYDKASFPRNIAPPRLRWEDEINNLWMLSITAPGWSGPLRVVTAEREWRPDAATWEAIKESKTGEWIDVELRGCGVQGGERIGDKAYVDRVKIRVSPYPADPIIVYRLVSPLFHAYKTPDIRYRHIGTFETRMFLPSKNFYCTNCHSFPGNPNLEEEDLSLAVAVRAQLALENRQRILGLYDFDTREGKTLNINSFFMSWDPKGTKVAGTEGHAVTVRPLITLETQEFYVLIADIMIVDSKTLETTALPGASTPQYMESFPSWSPDGKTIAFARADEMREKFSEKRFDLCTVPYNDGKGGEPTLVRGASRNEKSNFAPRFSPDGKWIVFNMADWSSLVAPTADLWIVSTEEGAMPRKLECNYDYAMDSHHSWSSNSRWLLFASKRDDGVFARIYFTEIDEDGHASPPVEMPVLEDSMMCYNVPEFLKYEIEIDAEDVLRKTSELSQ